MGVQRELTEAQVQEHGAALLDALDGASCTTLLSQRFPQASLADAFAVGDTLVQMRKARGERPVGWKIGFTNRSIWTRYGVHAPIWAPVWDTSTAFLRGTDGKLSLGGLCQPRLEPEIVFGLARAPEPGMDLAALQNCVAWVAHGFEVVHTHCEGWRFQAVDCVADFGLHGRLRIGPSLPVSDWPDLAQELAELRVDLYEGSNANPEAQLRDQGLGSVVLDGPVHALSHWLKAMAAFTPHWRVQAGDVVTTGTITDAWPLHPGQNWYTRVSGSRLGQALGGLAISALA